MKPGAPPLQSARLLDQVRERVRYLHYSLKTEKAYLYGVRFFVRWSATQPGGMRHPRDMGVLDVEAFLSMMANERKVSASTHNQALSAILFLYREVLNIDLPWLNNIGRPQQTQRIPSVLTKDEVAGLLAQLDGVTALLARLLYGTGMRLMEGMRQQMQAARLPHWIHFCQSNDRYRGAARPVANCQLLFDGCSCWPSILGRVQTNGFLQQVKFRMSPDPIRLVALLWNTHGSCVRVMRMNVSGCVSRQKSLDECY